MKATLEILNNRTHFLNARGPMVFDFDELCLEFKNLKGWEESLKSGKDVDIPTTPNKTIFFDPMYEQSLKTCSKAGLEKGIKATSNKIAKLKESNWYDPWLYHVNKAYLQGVVDAAKKILENGDYITEKGNKGE